VLVTVKPRVIRPCFLGCVSNDWPRQLAEALERRQGRSTARPLRYDVH